MINRTEACLRVQASCDSNWVVENPAFQLCSHLVNEVLKNFTSICQTGAKACGSHFAADAPQEQQASGQSIFWALATLALTAMAQESICAYAIRGKGDFEGTLVPHRSSPFVCLVDMLAEVFWMIHWKCNPPTETGKDFDISRRQEIDDLCKRLKGIYSLSPEEVYANSVRKTPNPYLPTYTREKRVVVTMKLLLFTVGTLPQATKLFSMRGIPVTQALAAVYFTASVVTFIRTLKSGPSKQNMDVLAFHVSNRHSLPKSKFRDTGILLFRLSAGLIRPLYTALMGLAWFQIARTAHFTVPVSVVNMMAVLELIMITVSLMGLGQTLFTFLFRQKSSPIGYISLAVGVAASLKKLFVTESLDAARTNLRTAPIGGAIMGVVLFASFILALLFDFFARQVVGPEEEEVLEFIGEAKTEPRVVEAEDQSKQEDKVAIGEASSGVSQLSPAESDAEKDREPSVPTARSTLPDALYFAPRLSPPDEEATLPGAVLIPIGPNTTSSSSTEVLRNWSKREIATLPFNKIIYLFAVMDTFLHFSVTTFFEMMESVNGDTYWVSFGISNFVTAAVYYMLYLNGSGTMNPRWTTVLG
jgi:hypothetical protein